MSEEKEQKGLDARCLRSLGVSSVLSFSMLAGCTGLEAVDNATEPMVATEVSDDDPIRIAFDGVCPKWVTPQEIVLAAQSDRKLHWQAYDLTGKAINTTAMYTVIFDPFVGRSIVAKKNDKGAADSGKLQKYIPSGVFFKYNIVADPKDVNDPNDPAKACAPLDPYVRIRR